MTTPELKTEIGYAIGEAMNEALVPESLVPASACERIAAFLVDSLLLESQTPATAYEIETVIA
ncbi:MAG: hypothetical protein NVSMB59_23210 [Vulcanimicrobiaceae bacterium]